MGKVSVPNPSNWQFVAFVAGLLGVLCLALTVVSIYAINTEVGRKSAYDHAAFCAGAGVSGCRYQGPAHVVSTWMDKDGPAVQVVFDQLGGRRESADLNPSKAGEWQTWEANSAVTAELWDGKLVAVAGVPTAVNPDEFDPSMLVPISYGAGLATLVGAAVWFWTRRVSHSLLQARGVAMAAESAAHPTTTEQLPLTPEMTAFLHSEADQAGHPARIVVPVVGATAAVPFVFSVIFLVQGRLLNWWVPVAWVFFLGLGAAFSWGLVSQTRLEVRDLAGGMFTRAAGLFTVATYSNRAGTSMVVTVGGRALKGVCARPLESIDAAVGTVDYLPVSGDLIEVRDESGHVLWTRFAAAPTT